ncbi:TolC family protein [Alistipes sp. kh20]|uniref:TolC family protein n=1 Tax=Alistipes TaxID=239759 RepID=UPI00189AA7EB|nr:MULTISPECIES: TolC family protein [Alistipes]MBS4765890.1 TolC family protein [Alistipes montrealensis]
MKIAVKIAFMAAAMAPAAMSAQETGQMLSLDEAIAVTLTENPALKAAAYEERAAQQERRAAIGLRMPQINVSGAYAYMAKDIGFDFNDLKGPAKDLAGKVLGSGLITDPAIIQGIQGLLNPMMGADWFLKVQDQSLGFVGGEVTVPIWMGGKINAANRAAKINEKTAVEQGNQTRNALISELVERYFGLALATQVVEVRQQVVDGVRKHLEDARALEKNGMIAQTERLYVEFKMAEAERELANAKLQAETIASALSNTLGRENDWRPVTAMFILGKVEELAYYQDLAQTRNPLLSQVSLKRELAQEGVRAQRANFLPQVAAIGGGSFYNYQVAGLVPRWAVGVGVNIKIFDGLNREYKYSAAKQTVRRVGELQNKAGKDISVLVEKLYNQMMNYRNQMTSIDSSLKFAEEYLRMKNAAFLEGMSSSSDLIDAELNLAGVRTERLQAAYNYDLLLAQLLEAAGISDEFPAYARRNDAQAIHFAPLKTDL